MREERKIPFKNYIFLSIILLLSIIGVIYFYMWYSEIEENRLGTPILNEYLNIINYNELNDYLVENKDAIVYVSVLDNYKTREFEKKFKRKIEDYSLNNTILYLNLTDVNNKIVSKFMKDYNISSIPCIITFRNGYVIDIYDIVQNKYDVELLVSYFRIEGIIND